MDFEWVRGGSYHIERLLRQISMSANRLNIILVDAYANGGYGVCVCVCVSVAVYTRAVSCP